jgi:hypothetical protein
MSDDLFFEGEEPTEEPKKKPAPKKPAPKAAPKKGGQRAAGSAPVRKAAPKKDAGFEFTPMVVVLIAIIAILIGFLLGLLASNVLLTPQVNQAPPASQQMPPGDQGGMGGMGGMGMGNAPDLSDEELQQLMEEGGMPAGHPPIDEDGNVELPADMEGVEQDADVAE